MSIDSSSLPLVLVLPWQKLMLLANSNCRLPVPGTACSHIGTDFPLIYFAKADLCDRKYAIIVAAETVNECSK